MKILTKILENYYTDKLIEQLRLASLMYRVNLNQYTNGATPMIILQDLINITHDIAKVKIAPGLLNTTSFSEVEKKSFSELSATCSLAILSKIWQMLIKGVGEINLAPSAVEALEMILLRVAYSASLPTPMELLNEVKKNSSVTTVSPISNTVETEKKNDINVIKQNSDYEIFTQVEDLLQYLEKNKKALIEYSIKNEIEFREFSDGHIAITISPNIHQDFIMNFHKLLTEATGKKWEIDIIRGELGETIADKEKTAIDAKKKNIAEYPLVKKILEEFRGAKIETITRKNLEKIAESEPEIEEIGATDIEEED